MPSKDSLLLYLLIMGFSSIKQGFYTITNLTIAAVFLIAGIQKLIDPDSFVVLIDSYGLLWEPFLLPIAIVLPVTEIVCGIGIVFRKKWAVLGIAALTLMFIAILTYGIWMGLDVDCGCFGTGDPEYKAYSGLQSALIKDVVLLLGVGYLFVFNGPNLGRLENKKQ